MFSQWLLSHLLSHPWFFHNLWKSRCYYSILKIMFNGNLNLRHQSEWTNIFDKSQRMVRMCSAEKKVYVNFVRRKYYSLALNHEVYSKVYIHQLFSISINFTGKFCHWHRQKWSSIFLRKNFYERF